MIGWFVAAWLYLLGAVFFHWCLRHIEGYAIQHGTTRASWRRSCVVFALLWPGFAVVLLCVPDVR